MPKIIVTSRYIAPSVPKSHLEYYTKYIATRPGVVINNTNSVGIEPQKPSNPNDPVSEKQKQMIDQLLQDFKDAKKLFEYEDYINNPTQGTASDLISAVIDRNADIVIGKSAYTHYLGERPGVVKDGEHGLFSQDGQSVDLNKVAQEVAAHRGNVWTHVVSLRRSDAELSGYAYNDEQITADAWRSLVRRHILTMAKQTKIKPENLQWYAAFHNKETNPHVHIMIYSKDPKEGYLTKNGIEKIRSAFANDIYSEELSMLNEHQTELRNELRSSAAMAFDKIASQLRAGTLQGQQKLYDNIMKLKNILDSTKGKKVYKFLKPEAKAVVDSITQQICRNKDIAAKCRLSERTVSRILHKLENKGYLTILKGYRADRLTGTYTYILAEVSSSYTMVDRKVFEYGLTSKQLKLYLFINKCIDKKLGYCWNSYKDLASSLNLKRSETITLIKQLVVMKKLRKIRKLRYDNRNEYSDNIYSTKTVKMIKRKFKNLTKIEKRVFLYANKVGANLSVLYINQLFYCENKYKC